MPLVTRIRHLGAFALVEANNRLFIDGQAHTPNNLAPIAFDKLGAISAISTQKTDFMGDPLFSMTRATWIQPILGFSSSPYPNNILFDSTITSCGKNIGSVGVRYDSVNKQYYVGNKTTQYQANDGWSLKVYDSQFDLKYSADLPKGDTFRGTSVYFLNPKVDSAQLCIMQSLSVQGSSFPTNSSRVVKFNAGITSQPTALLTNNGWYQVVHQDSTDTGTYTIIVDSSMYFFDSNKSKFANAYAFNRNSGGLVALGTTSPNTGLMLEPDVKNSDGIVTKEGTYYLFEDAYGCLASNAEFVDGAGSGNDPIFFYTMRTQTTSTGTYRHSINVCKIDKMNTETPELGVTTCVYTPTDFTFPNDSTSATRRFKLFIIRDSSSGIDYLCSVGYEPAGVTTNNMSQACMCFLVFRIGGANKNELTYISQWKVALGDSGIVRAAMPMDSSLKKWLICYTDKFSVYQWNPSTGFTLQSTQNIQPSWVGVDGLGRLWVAESEILSAIFGDGQKLYYFPSSGTAIALQAAFQSESYTFSGTPINSNIKINAYDLSGQRTSVEVLVNLEGSNVTFADGSTRKQLTTSSSGDTLVPIIVKSTGLLRATIMEAV